MLSCYFVSHVMCSNSKTYIFICALHILHFFFIDNLTIEKGKHYFIWRQDSLLVAWLTHGGTGLESRCGRYLSLVHTYAVTQTVQMYGIIMTTERITDSHRIKKRTKNKEIKMTNMSKLTCKRSIKPLIIMTCKNTFPLQYQT